MLLPSTRKVAAPTTSGSRSRKSRRAPGSGEGDLDERARDLFEALRAYRLETARQQKVPPYVVASDRSLRDIAMLRPGTLGELELAHGIGPAKVEKYGEALLSVVRRAPSG